MCRKQKIVDTKSSFNVLRILNYILLSANEFCEKCFIKKALKNVLDSQKCSISWNIYVTYTWNHGMPSSCHFSTAGTRSMPLYSLQTLVNSLFVQAGSSRTFCKSKFSCFLSKHQLGAHISFKLKHNNLFCFMKWASSFSAPIYRGRLWRLKPRVCKTN